MFELEISVLCENQEALFQQHLAILNNDIQQMQLTLENGYLYEDSLQWSPVTSPVSSPACSSGKHLIGQLNADPVVSSDDVSSELYSNSFLLKYMPNGSGRKRLSEEVDEEVMLSSSGWSDETQLSPLGIKNYKKLKESGQLETGPPDKKCQLCGKWMNWRLNGPIQKQRNGRYTYQGHCNGECQKKGVNDILNPIWSPINNQKAAQKRREEVGAFIYQLGHNISQKCTFENEEGIDFALAVALDGCVKDFNFPSRSKEEREDIYRRLESESLPCHHCGVCLKFLSESGFEQFTCDRLIFDSDGTSLSYDDSLQVSVRSCYFCQRLFGDANEARRSELIQTLIDFFDEEYADKVVRCFVENVPDDEASAIAVHREHTTLSTKHWTTVWKNQEKSRREQCRDRLMRAHYRKSGCKKTPKPSNLEDIRDWSQEEMLEHLCLFCNICVITGIPLDIVGLHCDRIWNGRYNSHDTVSMWGRLNIAKEAHPCFTSKASFAEYCEKNGISGHPVERLIQILRIPVVRLCRFQMVKQ